MSEKEAKDKVQKPKEPLKDVTGDEISEEQLKEVAGGECTTNPNTLNYRRK
jgi:hypothetical protein